MRIVNKQEDWKQSPNIKINETLYENLIFLLKIDWKSRGFTKLHLILWTNYIPPSVILRKSILQNKTKMISF